MSRRWRVRLLFGALGVAGLWLMTSGTSVAQESCFVSKINAARGGRGALAVNGDLVAVARRHSAKMAASGTIYHNGSLSSQAPDGWQSLGENVGMGPSCDVIHDAFMNSSSHRANIMDPDFNFVGVGVVIAGDGTMYVTEVFMQKEASQPAQGEPAPTNPTAAAPRRATAPRATTPRATAPRGAPQAPPPAEAPPPPPPPPPPGSKVTGQTRSYMEGGLIESELFPSAEQQKEYALFLEHQDRLREQLRKMEKHQLEREHNLFSKLAALVAASFAAAL